MVQAERKWWKGPNQILMLAAAVVCSQTLYFALSRWAGMPQAESNRIADNGLSSIPEWVGASLLLYVLYLVLVFLLRNFVDDLDQGFRGLKTVLALAILFRVTVAWMSPVLSDDVYRYRWEGMLQAEGGNPYAVTPDDAGWQRLRDATYPRIPIRDYPGGYGPLVMLAERAAYGVASAVTADPWRQAMGMKMPAMLADLAVMGLLLGWLRSRGRPLAWVAVYALCPLVVIEFWGMGHNDALALAFLVGAFWALDERRDRLGFVLLAGAVAVKWWPALLLPAAVGFSRQAPRRAMLAAAGLLVVPLAMLPYWTDLSLNLKFMGGFAGGWRNNDSLFGITYVLAGGDFEVAKQWTLWLLGVWCLAVPLLFRDRVHGVLAAIAGVLLLAANCHPWYLTWLLPFLVFAPWPPLLLWVGLTPLFYEVLIEYHLLGIWEGSRPGRWLVYGPVIAAMAGWWLRVGIHGRTKPCGMVGVTKE